MIVRLGIDYRGFTLRLREQEGSESSEKKWRIRINITALYAFIPAPALLSILTVV